jgi:hypothetical protein
MTRGRQVSVVGPMQASINEYLSSNRLVLPGLVRVVAKKLEAQGATITDDLLAWLEEEFRKRITNDDGLSWDNPIHSESHLVDGTYSIDLNQSELEVFSDQVVAAIPAAVTAAIESFFTTTMAAVREQAAAVVAERYLELEGFQRRLQQRWGAPLQLLAVQLGLSIQFGADLNQWVGFRLSEGSSSLVECVLRLHARACQIAGEVEALLRAGFADGALSRWRTLHEISVVAIFLQERGEDVAQRYLDHLAIDSLDLARKCASVNETLGPRPFSLKELQDLEARAAALKLKHGKDFGHEYGWAASALNIPSPNFTQIEKAVSLERYRPYYKLASGTIHAGPKGAFWKLGHIAEAPPGLLAGPSNAGLEEAGRLTAHSLGLIGVTAAIVTASIDATVWARVICELSEDVEAAFISASAKLLNDERRFNGVYADQRCRQVGEKLSARLRRRQGRT